MHVKKTEGLDIRAGISMDQIAAQHLGAETQLASLELGVDSVETLGACDAGYSCAYTNTIAWRTATTPLPMENDPRAVFERLFGSTDSTDVAARLARIRQDRSVLDYVGDRVAGLQKTLGPGRPTPSSTSISTPCATWSAASGRPRSRATARSRCSSSRPGSPTRSRRIRGSCSTCWRWRTRPT